MLPGIFPGARVLVFSYPKLRVKSMEGDQADYIESVSLGLLHELGQARHSHVYDKVPIVFIGAGLGGIIVQNVISLTAKKEDPSTEDPESKERGKSAETERPPFELDHLADVVFLDTPFPNPESGVLKDFFPPNTNVRMCAIMEVMAKMEKLWEGIDAEIIWDRFWTSVCRLGKETRILWFHSTGRTHLPPKMVRLLFHVQPGDVGADNFHSQSLLSHAEGSQAILLSPLYLHRLRRLTNFPSPDDSSYRWIATNIRDGLMFKAVSGGKFEELQRGLMKSGSLVNAKDERGLSLLHRAVTYANPVGVNMLLGNHANPQIQDPDGQTPLHYAIRMFCEDDENDETSSREAARRHLTNIIRQLLDYTSKSELYNSRDRSGKAPQDILHYDRERCGCFPNPCSKHEAIRELLNSHQPIVNRRMGEHKEEPWKGWSPPPKKGPKHKACVRSKAIVAEFYKRVGDEAGKRQLLADYYVSSVLELIYQIELGPVKILSKLTERHVHSRGDVCCRWIHVPANNVSSGPLPTCQAGFVTNVHLEGTMAPCMCHHCLGTCGCILG